LAGKERRRATTSRVLHKKIIERTYTCILSRFFTPTFCEKKSHKNLERDNFTNQFGVDPQFDRKDM